MIPNIGYKFKYCELTLEVCESEDGSCKGCFFNIESENICTAFTSRWATPECTDNYHHVIFKHIEDGKTEI